MLVLLIFTFSPKVDDVDGEVADEDDDDDDEAVATPDVADDTEHTLAVSSLLFVILEPPFVSFADVMPLL